MKGSKKELFRNTSKMLLISIMITFVSCQQEYKYDDVIVTEPLQEVNVDSVTAPPQLEMQEEAVMLINQKLAFIESEIHQLQLAMERVSLYARENISTRIEDLEKTKAHLNSKLKEAEQGSQK